MLQLGALIFFDKTTLKPQIDLGVLWRPCRLSRLSGNVLCFDVKEDERNESLLDRCPVSYCAIWYIMFSEGDLAWSMV